MIAIIVAVMVVAAAAAERPHPEAVVNSYYFFFSKQRTAISNNDNTQAAAATTSASSPGRTEMQPHHDEQSQLLQHQQQQEQDSLIIMGGGLILESIQDRFTTSFSSRADVLATAFPQKWEEDRCVLRQRINDKIINNNINNNRSTIITMNVLVLGGSTASRPGNDCGTNYTTMIDDDDDDDPFAGRYSNLLETKLNHDWELLQQNNNNNSSSSSSTPSTRIRWKVINMGQGSESSVQGGLLLDGTIPDLTTPDAPDVIIWDYSVNDSSRLGGTPEEVRKLKFWLTRIQQFYTARQAGQAAAKTIPPIILTYLWKHRAGIQLKKGLIHELDRHPMSYIGELLDYYKPYLNIAVVNLGGSVNITALLQQQNEPDGVHLLFDDSQHPSCAGTNLLADLLEYTILENLLFANDCPPPDHHNQDLSSSSSWEGGKERGNNDNNNTTIAQRPQQPQQQEEQATGTTPLPWPNTGTRFEDLWVDLFNPQAEIGSLSPWVPRVLGQTNLNITFTPPDLNATTSYYPSSLSSWPLELIPIHTDATREDRKYGYRIPSCSPDDESTLPLPSSFLFRFTLHEPNLKWLGLSIRIANSRQIQLRIQNNTDGRVVVPLEQWEVDKWDYGNQMMTHWINLHNIANTTSGNNNSPSSLELTFCHTIPSNGRTDQQLREWNHGELPNLQYLIGVSLPPP